MTEHNDASTSLADLDPVLSDLANATRSRDAEDPAFDEDVSKRVLDQVHRVVRGSAGNSSVAEAVAPKYSRLRTGAVLAAVGVLVAFAGSRLLDKGDASSPSAAEATAATGPRKTASEPLPEAPAPPAKSVDTVPTMHVDDLPTSAAAPAPRAPVAPAASSSGTPAPPPNTVGPAGAGTDLAEEYRLIEGGRAGLAARDYARALESLREHEKRFPSGQLNQECESLQIEVLVAADRLAEARERARSFQTRFPNGLLMPSVTRALAGSSVDAPKP